jgi:hypothetical protein
MHTELCWGNYFERDYLKHERGDGMKMAEQQSPALSPKLNFQVLITQSTQSYNNNNNDNLFTFLISHPSVKQRS